MENGGKPLGRKGTLFMKAMQYMTLAFVVALIAVVAVIKQAPAAGDVLGLLVAYKDCLVWMFGLAVGGNGVEHVANSFGKPDKPPEG